MKTYKITETEKVVREYTVEAEDEKIARLKVKGGHAQAVQISKVVRLSRDVKEVTI